MWQIEKLVGGRWVVKAKGFPTKNKVDIWLSDHSGPNQYWRSRSPSGRYWKYYPWKSRTADGGFVYAGYDERKMR